MTRSGGIILMSQKESDTWKVPPLRTQDAPSSSDGWKPPPLRAELVLGAPKGFAPCKAVLLNH